MITAVFCLLALGVCLAVAVWVDDGFTSEQTLGLVAWEREDHR